MNLHVSDSTFKVSVSGRPSSAPSMSAVYPRMSNGKLAWGCIFKFVEMLDQSKISRRART